VQRQGNEEEFSRLNPAKRPGTGGFAAGSGFSATMSSMLATGPWRILSQDVFAEEKFDKSLAVALFALQFEESLTQREFQR
jgi:hypothetical protein